MALTEERKRIPGSWSLFLLILVVYVSVYGLFLADARFRPYVSDNVETYSTFVHARNTYRFGLAKSYGLSDEGITSEPAGHPYVYTHEGNFPRWFILLIYYLGAHTIEAQILVTTLTVGLATVVFAFLYFDVIAGPIFAFIACGIMLSDYVFFMQWQVDTYRVWHGFFLFLTLLCAHGISGRHSRLWLAVTVVDFLCLFYFELTFATFVAVLFGIYVAYLYRNNSKHALRACKFALSGAVLSLALLAGQVIAYLGFAGFLKDAYFTFVARNYAQADTRLAAKIREFFEDKNVAYWYENVINTASMRSIKSLVNHVNWFNLAVVPPLLLVVSFLIIGAWVVSAIAGLTERRNLAQPMGPVFLLALCLGAFLAPVIVLALWGLPLRGELTPLAYASFLPMSLAGAVGYLLPNLCRIGLIILANTDRKMPGSFERTIRILGTCGLGILVPLVPTVLLQPSHGANVVASAPGLAVLFRLIYIFTVILAAIATSRARLVASWLRQVASNAGSDPSSTGDRIRKFGGISGTAGLVLLMTSLDFPGPNPISALTVSVAISITVAVLVRELGRSNYMQHTDARSSADMASVDSRQLSVNMRQLVVGGTILLGLVVLPAYQSAVSAVLGTVSKPYAPHTAAFAIVIGLSAVVLIYRRHLAKVSARVQERHAHSKTELAKGVANWAWRWNRGRALVTFVAATTAFVPLLLLASRNTARLQEMLVPNSVTFMDLATGAASILTVMTAFKLTTAGEAKVTDIGPTRSLLSVVLIALAAVFVGNLLTLFDSPYYPGVNISIWKTITLDRLPVVFTWLAVAAAGLLALMIAFGDRQGWFDSTEEAGMARVGAFLCSAFAAYAVIYFLAPGYILSAYLYRWGPFASFIVETALALVVYTIFRATLSAVRQSYAVSMGVHLRMGETAMGALHAKKRAPQSLQYAVPVHATTAILLVLLLTNTIFAWLMTQYAYWKALPPQHYSFLTTLRNSPYRGASFVIDNYQGPVIAYTDAWASYDPEFVSGDVTLNDDGFKIKRDLTKYLWAADKRINTRYEKPDYYLCLRPQNPVPTAILLNSRKLPFGCASEPIVLRAFGGGAESLRHHAVAQDHDKDSWTILRLDWDYPPYLKGKEANADPIGLNVRRVEGGIELTVDYQYAQQDNTPESGTIVRIYDVGEETQCGLGDKTRSKIVELRGTRRSLLPNRLSGKFRVSVIPGTARKLGPEYFSTIAIIPPNPSEPPSACPFRAIPLSLMNPYAVGRGSEIEVRWTQVAHATGYFIEARERGSEFHSIASVGAASNSFTFSARGQTRRYEVRLKACNGPECGNYSAIVPVQDPGTVR